MGRARVVSDFYATPEPVAEAVVQRLGALIPPPRTIIEPSAGGGAFCRAARRTWSDSHITAYDIHSACRLLCSVGGADEFIVSDWLTADTARGELILGNPPFGQAQDHIEKGLARVESGGHLALILRLSMLGGLDRAQTLWARPGLRFFAPITPRPSFDGRGRDLADVGLFIWQQGYAGRAEIESAIVWRGGM